MSVHPGTCGASIWRSTAFSCINAAKNRAKRFFMGAGKHTPNLALYGDMGWKPCIVSQWSCIFRTWCRFIKMCYSKINIKKLLCGQTKNWNFRVHNIKKLLRNIYAILML